MTLNAAKSSGLTLCSVCNHKKGGEKNGRYPQKHLPVGLKEGDAIRGIEGAYVHR